MNKILVAFQTVIICYSLLIPPVFANAQFRLLGEPKAAQFETRCGWFVNPTPANIWLYDRDAEWTIGVQGGYQLEHEGPWPVFKPRQWVRQNGNYGYGCACLELRVNKETHDVLEIKSARARPLAACHRDKSLRKWKNMLK